MLHIYETREGHRLTKSEVADLQREICKQNDGKTPKNSFVAKAQAAADRNINLTSDTTDPTITRHFSKDGTKKVTKGLATKVASTVASCNKGIVKKGSFAARLQSAADRNDIQPETDDALISMLDIRGPHPITKDHARELQRSESLQNNGKTLKGSDAALAQSAADKLEMMRLKALETDAYHQLHQQHYKHHKKHTKEEKLASRSFEHSRSTDLVSEDEDEELTDPNRVNTRITAEAPPLAKDVGESRPTHR
jgi:hypothetical protein